MKPKRGGKILWEIARKATGVSIFTKMMGIALALITLFGTGTLIATRALMRDLVKEETDERSRILAGYVESGATDWLITGDFVAALGLLKRAAEIYPDVKYLFILSPQKRVLAGTLPFPLSRDIIEANSAGADGSFGRQLIDAEGEIINDVAAPLMGGRLGTLRIGITQGHIRDAVNALGMRLLMSLFLAAAIGAGISYLLAFILIRPILNLINGVRLVEKGDFNARVLPWFNDEIGALASAFNNMVGALGREKALKTELVRKLIASQEEERQRISRELHDKTGQSLTSLKIGLKVLETDSLPGGTAARLEQFRTLLNNSLEEIHDLAVELRPPALADFGLPQVAEELGRDFGKTLGAKFECAVDDYFRRTRLDPAVEIGLYRIIQEAFSNIGKHSGASVVRLAFAKTDGEIRITVKDNGRGFNCGPRRTEQGRKPLGLLGMKERAEILDGKFSILSEEDGGTEITVSLPAV